MGAQLSNLASAIKRAYPAATRRGSIVEEAAVLDVAFDHLLYGLHERGVYDAIDLTLKGGTALRKYHLGHRSRFSFDLDFDAEEGSEELVAEEIDGMAFPHFEFTAHERRGHYSTRVATDLLLTQAGIEVVEVMRPNRQLCRQRGGKSDSVDAEAAARAAASGEATSVPKSGVGPVECLRMLLVVHRSAVKARTQAANQIHSVAVTAPEGVKRRLRGLDVGARVRVCAAFRPGPDHTTTTYAKRALRRLARRYRTLDREIDELDVEIRRLCAQANPALLGAEGVGPDTAAALLVAVGDNPGRMKSEKSFAALCGSSPVQASSGQTLRYRLNRGGNRKANTRCGGSRPPGCRTMPAPKPT